MRFLILACLLVGCASKPPIPTSGQRLTYTEELDLGAGPKIRIIKDSETGREFLMGSHSGGVSICEIKPKGE